MKGAALAAARLWTSHEITLKGAPLMAFSKTPAPPPPSSTPRAPAPPAPAAVTPEPASTGSLVMTERAAEKIKTMLAAEQKDPSVYGLRVGVRAGGCSGMSYWMGFDIKRDDDAIATMNGAHVYCDPKSLQFLSGSTLDYLDGLQGAGFTFVNPHAKGGCGCGSSFSV